MQTQLYSTKGRMTNTFTYGTFPTMKAVVATSLVWINYNYMISKGLYCYGYNALADRIREKTIEVVNEWYEKNGTIYEFYDCENKKAPSTLRRKGDAVEPYNMRVRCQTIRDYGWSCTLTCDMIA